MSLGEARAWGYGMWRSRSFGVEMVLWGLDIDNRSFALSFLELDLI